VNNKNGCDSWLTERTMLINLRLFILILFAIIYNGGIMKNIIRATNRYGDMKGEISIDWNAKPGFYEFVESLGFKTSDYFPVGISFYRGDNGGMYISVYGVDKKEIGDDFKEISSFAKKNNNTLPVIEFKTEAELEDLQKYLREVSIEAFQKDIAEQFELQGKLELQ
jgi:hypothetical protein